MMSDDVFLSINIYRKRHESHSIFHLKVLLLEIVFKAFLFHLYLTMIPVQSAHAMKYLVEFAYAGALVKVSTFSGRADIFVILGQMMYFVSEIDMDCWVNDMLRVTFLFVTLTPVQGPSVQASLCAAHLWCIQTAFSLV